MPTMAMRYSSPPRTSSTDRSDVGWKLRERYLRRNQESEDGTEGSLRGGTRSARMARTVGGGIPSGFTGGSQSLRGGRSIPLEAAPFGRRVRTRGGLSRPDDDEGSLRSTRSAGSTLGRQLGNLPGARRPRKSSSLGSRGRERGGLDNHSVHSSSSRSSFGSSALGSRGSLSQLSSDSSGGIDPSLPPAFRVALRIEQRRRRMKNEKDDSSCLGSAASHCSTTANSTSCDWESLRSDEEDDSGADNSDDDDSSIGSADSFAALDSDDDEDDEESAIRETSRTQLARAEHEMKSASSSNKTGRRGNSRFPRMNNTRGVLGTPLGLIVEETNHNSSSHNNSSHHGK